MTQEDKLNLNAGDYAISHCDSDKTYNGLEVHKMLCDAYIAGNNDTLEDDDERIKNSLVNLIKMSSEVGGLALHKWEADEMLAWLKKQVEHANFLSKIQVGDKVTRNEAGVLVNLSQLNRVAKPEENKGNIGGISANWSEEDEKILGDIIEDVMTLHSGKTLGVIRNKINWLKSLKGRVQTKHEWSEEDSYYINNIIHIIEEIKNAPLKRREDWEAYINWLKSIKGRIQPKQEWSEEDKKIINGLIDSLTRISLNTRTDSTSPNYTFYKEIDWLKSIRFQNHWKPSDEQIAQLQIVIDTYGNKGICDPILTELLFQLKKLKEG